MTLKEIQFKLYESLKPSGWGDRLKFFLLSEDFTQIIKQLHTESTNGTRFTPIIKDIFNAFKECPYDKLSVVFINLEVYNKVNISDGIALSCNTEEPIEKPLDLIFDDIETTVMHPTEPYVRNSNLSRWSNQGVLMLNLGLTSSVSVPGSHVDLWKPFIDYVLDILGTYNSGLIYVFVGDKVKPTHKQIKVNNFKMFIPFPVPVYYKKHAYISGDVFNNINKLLFKLYGEKIIW